MLMILAWNINTNHYLANFSISVVFLPSSWSSVNTAGRKWPSSSRAIECWLSGTTLMTTPPKAPQYTQWKNTTGTLKRAISMHKKEPCRKRDLQVCVFSVLISLPYKCLSNMESHGVWLLASRNTQHCMTVWVLTLGEGGRNELRSSIEDVSVETSHFC